MLLDELGIGYAKMIELGFACPIVDTRVRYIQSVVWDSLIKISAQIVEWEYQLVMFYTIESDQGKLVNEATTTQVPIDVKTGELIYGFPSSIVDRLNVLTDGC